MEEQLISFDTAKLAKKKGFSAGSCHYYDYSGDLILNQLLGDETFRFLDSNTNFHRLEDKWEASTQSLLQKWLRDIHNLDVEPKLANQSFKKSYHFGIYTYNGEFRSQIVETNIRYNTYEDVLEAVLLETLKLI